MHAALVPIIIVSILALTAIIICTIVAIYRTKRREAEYREQRRRDELAQKLAAPFVASPVATTAAQFAADLSPPSYQNPTHYHQHK
ncbi:hypothetical protein PSACC_03128 [Paramicrosporidium saccamoebae]|uniref:Uncharacterized protein n=1 Tax=Paramicrosporidium saccamoebae TaxID=1246581 RepID=A0A2H9TH30_9FUNG|nr:hypothetical protein PSACC_03128 [Paramicrosporidium saccamoebae]